MSNRKSKKEYPNIYEKAVPIILGILALIGIVMVITSILALIGVFQ